MNKSQIKNSRQKDKKTMTMYWALYPGDNVDRLYIPRKSGGRGIISLEHCAEMKIKSMKKYVESRNERLVNAVEREGILGSGKMKKEVIEMRNKNFMEKPLHLKFVWKTNEGRSQEDGTG